MYVTAVGLCSIQTAQRTECYKGQTWISEKPVCLKLSCRELRLAEARFPRGTLLGFSMNRGNPLLGILVQMWRKKQTEKGSLKEEATPPEGYVSAPPGYRYWSPTPSSSSIYYRKRLEPEEAPYSSISSFRRRVLSIVLIAILAIDLLAMFYGGYLSNWQLLTQPSGIFWAALGLIAAIGLLASAYEKIFSPRVRRTISRNAPLVSALI